MELTSSSSTNNTTSVVNSHTKYQVGYTLNQPLTYLNVTVDVFQDYNSTFTDTARTVHRAHTHTNTRLTALCPGLPR